MSNQGTITTLSDRLRGSEDNLVITITGEAFIQLKRLSSKMKNVGNPKEAVETAIELLLRAEDKDVAILDNGRVVSTYSLWN
jgi:hypothetical protein